VRFLIWKFGGLEENRLIKFGWLYWVTGCYGWAILSYIVILRAHDNRIVMVLQLSSYRLYIISGAFT